MPITTNLNISPYFDDYNPAKDYYKILFKPGTSVQTRELNQIQTIFQTQIERFGDNILKKGTIVDGCNFSFNNSQAYVKLVDNELNGLTSIPALYVGNFVKNSSNLTAFIVNFFDGFESTSPDLKTIYVNYINSGNDGQSTAFTPGETLTIYNPKNSIYKVNIVNGGSGFSNNDTLIFTSQIAISITSGSFSTGDSIYDSAVGGLANLEIVAVDTTTLAADNLVLLKVKPRTEDLINEAANSSLWTMPLFTTVENGAGATATVSGVYGEQAQGKIITNASGVITDISIQNRGENYVYAPYVSVRSINNVNGVSDLELVGQNFVAQIKASSETGAVGKGYTFSVSDGVIYQRGYFERVNFQTVIVEKYNTEPNNLVVGFRTVEEIVDSNFDTSLLDNALGSENETAPGADRLKLTPELIVLNKDDAAANTEFFSIVEFNDGNPYKQNQLTVYNKIGDEIARSGYDQSGNFVLDAFQVTTDSTSNSQNEGLYYTAVVDPGQAYISGYKVQTLNNYRIDIVKGFDTKTATSPISLNYGSYIKIKEVGGNFLFNVGAAIDLYNLPKNFISNTSLISTGNTSPLGTKIGTARMRSLILDSDIPGTANSEYRLYVFDIKMTPGQNFNAVKSVYYNGDFKGIADIVLESDGKARLRGTLEDGLIFPAGVESLKNSNNANYTYRTIDQNSATGNNGILTKSISSIQNEYFESAGNLSISELRDLYIVPLANNLIQATNLDGTISISTTSSNVTGTSTKFDSAFNEGDYLVANNGVSEEIKQVVKIFSNTLMQVDSVFGTTNTSASFTRVFPKNVPVPFGYRDGLRANVDVNRKVLSVTFAHSNDQVITFRGTNSVNTAIAYNIRRENVSSVTKTANRKRFVKIRVANNVSGVTGPWCMGVPDIFRLRNVYVSQSSNVNTASPNIIDRCYIDHNQNPNYLGLGYLYLNDNTKFTLTSNDYLLVEFDYFTRDGDGYFDTVSYLRTSDANTIAQIDSLPLSNLTTSACSLEIPEVYTYNNQYYDLLNQLDFRPEVANTVAPSLTATSAPVNPSETEIFNVTNDKKFPYPDKDCLITIEQYLGRVDDIYIGEKGNIYSLQGIPSVDPKKRYTSNHPKDSLKLQVFTVPPYPTVTQTLSDNVAEILNTKIYNEKKLNLRLRTHTVMPMMTTSSQQLSQPMVYTMEDIGNLERRIKDLEYYVSLSILETNITNKIIPSSIDPALNRFKFGFFADDFSTEIYSDVANPQFASSFEVEGDVDFGFFGSPLSDTLASQDTQNPISTTLVGPSALPQRKTNRVVPPKFVWSLNHIVDNLTYADEVIIEQLLATESSVCVPNVQTITNTTVISTNAYFYSQQKSCFNFFEKKVDTVVFGDVAGLATLYFYNYAAVDKYTIYQGNSSTPIAGTAASFNQVTALNSADIAFLTTNQNAAGWYNAFQKAQLTRTFSRGILPQMTDYVRFAGKIQWNHNPALGKQYTIVTDKGFGSVIWKYLIQYPASQSITTTTTVDVANCTVVPPTPVYNGTLTVRGVLTWSCSNQFRINAHTYTAYVVDCTGLKPNTIHKFYLDGQETNTTQLPVFTIQRPWGVEASNKNNSRYGADMAFDYGLNDYGGNAFKLFGFTMSGPLKTDAQGKLSFQVYTPIKDLAWVVGALGVTGGIYNNGPGILGSLFNPTGGSSGYSTLEVKDTNSSAKLVVANRAPNKVLPFSFFGIP